MTVERRHYIYIYLEGSTQVHCSECVCTCDAV
jgi:hypothetical protein